MTDEEILEGLKAYTSKPEVIEKALKLREAIKDIKANMESYCDMNCPYSEKQREFMCKACMMGDAIDMVDNYTEGLT